MGSVECGKKREADIYFYVIRMEEGTKKGRKDNIKIERFKVDMMRNSWRQAGGGGSQFLYLVPGLGLICMWMKMDSQIIAICYLASCYYSCY